MRRRVDTVYVGDVPAMSDEEQIEAKRVTWRGITFDSQLEADWCATFSAWDVEFVYHPGRLALDSGGVWEPDFQLDGDVVFEVKGEHNDRIEKADEARRMGFKVIVGRAGIVLGDNSVERAAAVWEPGGWVFDDLQRMFVHWKDASEFRYWSADLPNPEQVIGWHKAVGDDGVV